MTEKELGRTLHREFVGMLFALAIAEVAVQAARVANSGVPFKSCLPAYSHLFLAAMIIATSWVGWGWSKHSLSNVRHVFTCDFFELLVDLWLVAVYFFIVKGVELPVSPVAGQPKNIVPSDGNETFWITVVFCTYFIWDLITKIYQDDRAERQKLATVGRRKGTPNGWFKRDEKDRFVIFQRGWASLLCAALAIIGYLKIRNSVQDIPHVILADAALLSLLFLFRAMKIRDRSDLILRDYLRIGLLFLLALILFVGAIEYSSCGKAIATYLSSWVT